MIDVDESIGLNELTTLHCLGVGLSALAQQVRLVEAPLIQQENERRKKIFFYGFGLLSPAEEFIVPCYFHWFGASVCNYARLVGYLSGLANGSYTREQSYDPGYHSIVRQHCSDYVDSIPELRPIKVWRNKVFAHFAITDPRSNDSAALLDASIMSPITYMDSRLRVGGTISGSYGAEVEMPKWSVTESYEALASRFWAANDTYPRA